MTRFIALFFAILLPVMAQTEAQAQASVALGGINADPTAPVEVTADKLTVDQDTRTAVFSGNVLIGQGDMRLSAAEVQVFYDNTSGEIARFVASGGVTLATATEAAEAQTADYDLASGILLMEGDVILTQGNAALSAQRMRVDLNAGTAQMEGRVSTVFRPEDAN